MTAITEEARKQSAVRGPRMAAPAVEAQRLTRIALEGAVAGDRLRMAREAARLSHAALAQALGVDEARAADMERYFGPTAQQQHLQRAADVLEVAPGWLSGAVLAEDVVAEGGDGWNVTLTEAYPARRFTRERREWLAARAARRRAEIAMEAGALAAALGWTVGQVSAAEHEVPARTPQEAIARWERALSVSPGWLLDESVAGGQDRRAVACMTVADELARLARMTGQALQARYLAAARSDAADRARVDAQMLAQRFGAKGAEASRMAQVAQDAGMTAGAAPARLERIMEVALEVCPATPRLDALLDQVALALPASIERLDERFSTLLGPAMSTADAIRLGAWLRRAPLAVAGVDMPGSGRVRLAVDREGRLARDVPAIVSMARRMVRAVGAANVDILAGTFAREHSRGMSATLVADAVAMAGAFEWLDQASGWFWFGAAGEVESGALAECRKVLTVAQTRVDLEDLHQGFLRTRIRDHIEGRLGCPFLVELPRLVLAQALRRAPWATCRQTSDFCLVAQERERAAEELRALLTTSEHAAYEVLAASGGCATREAVLKAVSMHAGLSKAAVVNMLAGSPIIRALDAGIVALRGWPIEADAIVRALAERGPRVLARRGRKEAEAEASEAATEIVLSERHLGGANLYLPGAVKRQVALGEYDVQGLAEPVEVAADANGQVRLTRLMRQMPERADLRAGDALVLAIHARDRRITYRVERR